MLLLVQGHHLKSPDFNLILNIFYFPQLGFRFFGVLGAFENIQQLIDLMGGFSGMTKIHIFVDPVLIAAAIFLDSDVTAIPKILNYAPNRPFGDANQLHQVTNSKGGVFTQGHQDMPVVGK